MRSTLPYDADLNHVATLGGGRPLVVGEWFAAAARGMYVVLEVEETADGVRCHAVSGESVWAEEWADGRPA